MSGVEHIAFGAPDGTAVVLLHGIGSGKESWKPVARHLDDLRLLAWDMPGYGASEALAADWPDAGDYARALAGWLDMLGVSRCTLVGHSLGALIAARFAADRPDRVDALLLASPALGHGVAPPALSRAAQARLDAFETEGALAFAAQRAPRLLNSPDATALNLVQSQMARLTAKGHVPAARLLSGGTILADILRLRVPTAFVTGDADRVTPPANARACHDACPPAWRGALTVIPGAGHALATEAPAALATAIRDIKNERATEQ
jgi:pimeloyl-ACP methyl ester carboxylesterase